MGDEDDKAESATLGYVPAERLFVPILEQDMDDVIAMVLRVGEIFKEAGNLPAVVENYEHFIKGLRRFTMVPLGGVITREKVARSRDCAELIVRGAPWRYTMI